MTLIIVIAAILIERFWQGIKSHQDKNYFNLAVAKLLEIVPDKVKSKEWLLLIVLLLVPFVLIYFVHLILLNILGGLIALLFDIVLLLICVRSRPQNEMLDDYIDAQQRNDETQAGDLFLELTEKYIQTVDKPNSYMTRFIILQNLRRWFGVIFYFVFLGPAGVVIYRALQEYQKVTDAEFPIRLIDKALALLEWPVSRLLALTFFLSGSFDDALDGWKKYDRYNETNDDLLQGSELEQSNQKVLLCTGCAAISHDAEDATHDDTAYVRAAQGMLGRSLVIWCALIAGLTLAGVFH